MDVKEAIGSAREYLAMVFTNEDVSDVRLEEVVYDRQDDAWLITFGLMRPSVNSRGLSTVLTSIPLKRSYKVVRVPSDPDEPPSVKIRELAED